MIDFVAELSANHLGDYERAKRIALAAATSGATIFKTQLFIPGDMTLPLDTPDFTIQSGQWQGRTLWDLYQEAMTPVLWQDDLFKIAHDNGLRTMTSVFSRRSIDAACELECDMLKIASFEFQDAELIRYAVSTGLPLVLSTGMASDEDICRSLNALNPNGKPCNFVLLHCVSGYPADPADMHLIQVERLRLMSGRPSGLSDHTLTPHAAVAATALGAVMIEKHLTMSRRDGGLDASFSLEPAEFKATVDAVNATFASLRDIRERPAAEVFADYRRSLYVCADVRRGQTLTSQNIRSIRPGYGMAPWKICSVLGKRAARDLRVGEPLRKEMIDEID